MAKSYSVTSAGISPSEDRAYRMRMYFIAMALRVLCVVSLFWVRGWWVLLVAAGAVILPWFAVMVGNAVAHNSGPAPDAPEPQQLTAPPGAMSDDAETPQVIVVDVEPTRRSASRAPTADFVPGEPAPSPAGSAADSTNLPRPAPGPAPDQRPGSTGHAGEETQA